MKPPLNKVMFMSLLLSILGAISIYIGNIFFHENLSLNISIILISNLYLGYFLFNSPSKTGKIFTLLCGLILSTGLTILIPNNHSLTIPIFLVGLSLIRCIYYYPGALASFCDLLLTLLAYTVAVWVLSQTHSWFMCFWCFFLIQSLSIFLPNITNTKIHDQALLNQNDDFLRAYKTAQNAINKLT